MQSIDPILDATLRERAELYRSRGQHDGEDKRVEYLLIRSGALRCAIKIESLAGILAMPELTSVPHMPKSYLGVFARRGILHEAFSLPVILNENAGEHPSMVLVREQGASVLGLAVSEILGIDALSADVCGRVSDPHWPEYMRAKLSQDIYLLDVDVLISQLKNTD